MAAVSATSAGLGIDDLERHRRELTDYCYGMLGSGFEAEDAVQETMVQETMVRAWRGTASFEDRSSVRSWMYRIATNGCLDMLRGRKRRSRPMEMGPSMPPEPESLAAVLPGHSWVSPIADERILPTGEIRPKSRPPGRASDWPSSPRCSTSLPASAPR